MQVYQKHLQNNLYNTPQGKRIYQYLLDRGLTKDSIGFFGFGVAMGKGMERKALTNKPHHVTLGNLTSKYQTPTFTNRVTLPLIKNGEILGYVARTMQDIGDKYLTPYTAKHFDFFSKIQAERDLDGYEYELKTGRKTTYNDVVEIPKYKNTSDTKIFNKSEFLFNSDNVENFEHVMLAESQMNTIAWYQIGYRSTMGIGGTSLTKQHLEFLKAKGTKKITLAYDGDVAGLKGMERTVFLILEYGIIPYVIIFPKNQDAMDLLKSNKDELYKLGTKVFDGVRFVLHQMNKNKESVYDVVILRPLIRSLIKMNKKYTFITDNLIHQKFSQEYERQIKFGYEVNKPKVKVERLDKNVENKIKEYADIVEIVSHYREVKKVGASFKCVCPFHNDTKPSMVLSPSKNIYKCFSCGEGGDSIKFVSELKKLNYVESLKEIAKIMGVSV